MSDPSPAPTPTNEQRDVRDRVLDVILSHASTNAAYPISPRDLDAGRARAGALADAVLAAVSAAAPEIPEACDGGADPTLSHEQHPWPCGDATALDERRRAAAAPDERALRSALASVVCNAANYPAEVGAHVLGRDLSRLVDAVTAAALAARPAPTFREEYADATGYPAHDLPTDTGLTVRPAPVVSGEALDIERLPERFRFSREVYGDAADDATRVLLALTDGGHAEQPSDHLRWVSITAAQALATRPAPVVSGAEEWLSGPAVDMLPVGSVVLDYEAEAWQRVALGMWVCTSGDTSRSLAWADEPAERQEFRVLYRPTVADAPAADDEGGQA